MKLFKSLISLAITLAISTPSRLSAQDETTTTTPTDKTSLIKNPSFETNGTSGWTVKNMATQSNSVFSIKNGTYYVETWVSIGQKIADASIIQTLRNLPQGNYTLTANALHIQQTGSNSTANSGSAQTGAYLVAGLTRTPITSMKQYTISFSVLNETENVEIGLVAENATGNYLCVDNFKLQYTGTVSTTDYAQELQKLVKQGQAMLDKGVQNSVAEKLEKAIQGAETALQGNGTDDAGNTTYDQTALTEARTQLQTALKSAEASRKLYDTLQGRINYALKVIEWWDGEEHKATTLAMLKKRVEDSQIR